MSRTILKLALVDLVLLTGLYYVIQDLQWRSSYASSIHDACQGPCSYTPFFSHSILTQFFTMAGNNVNLTSPPTLDWVQLIVLALVVVNVWYGYSFFFERRKARPVEGASMPAVPNG